jgi:hypothetical protein
MVRLTPWLSMASNLESLSVTPQSLVNFNRVKNVISFVIQNKTFFVLDL